MKVEMMCHSQEFFFKRCTLLPFLSPTAWNWDMSTVILITTQDKGEGHCLESLGQNTGKSLGSFGASIPTLGYLVWDFFYRWEKYIFIFYFVVFCNMELNLILSDTHAFCCQLVHLLNRYLLKIDSKAHGIKKSNTQFYPWESIKFN